MSKGKRSAIEVQGTSISILSQPGGDYISLTDMVRNFDGEGALIEQWLKNKDTVLFLGVWERINNPDFNSLEFEGIRNEAGRNSFFLSAKKWIELTGAKGLIASAGRYGGTYAHKDIAFEFGSWLSPEFKLYLIKEFQRLKDEENDRLKLGWNIQRTLAKINYRIHTDAIKETLIPSVITKQQASLVYANEADLLNVALFGQTAKESPAYHMLTMSFVYFNIWQIKQTEPGDFEKGLIGFGKDIEKSLLGATSPFVFSTVNERSILRFIKLIACDNGKIGARGRPQRVRPPCVWSVA